MRFLVGRVKNPKKKGQFFVLVQPMENIERIVLETEKLGYVKACGETLVVHDIAFCTTELDVVKEAQRQLEAANGAPSDQD